MKDKDLLRSAASLGLPLFEAEELQDANVVLADVAKSKDLRLWEGFPVLLANSADRGLLNFNKLKSGPLVVMSLALYRTMNLNFPWVVKLYASLPKRQKSEYGSFLKKFKADDNLNVARHVMSSQRLKSVFNNYFGKTPAKLNTLLSVKDELGLEYALSKVFSPKQKELFFKKLKREKLTKTEKEYFSRVVRKKLLALANPELHRLSRMVLE